MRHYSMKVNYNLKGDNITLYRGGYNEKSIRRLFRRPYRYFKCMHVKFTKLL